MTIKIPIPPEIYTSDKACGEFIISLNEQQAKLTAVENAIKEAKDVACEVMLQRLEITGQKHFAFDFGTFSKTTTTQLSFPTADDGGKAKAVEWLQLLLDKGVIDLHDVLNVQQSRISVEATLALEQLARDYNDEHGQFDPDFKKLPDSPFNRYEKTTLKSPRKRK